MIPLSPLKKTVFTLLPALLFAFFILASQFAMAQPSTDANTIATLDLAALKEKHQNSLVKIEFTLIDNIEETKFNPTKSERYYAGDEPPHGTGFFISETEILTNAHIVEEARKGSIRVMSPATGSVEFKVDVIGVGNTESIDLAILSLPEDELVRFKKNSGLKEIPFLGFGDSDKVKQADTLAIFGYPESSYELKIIQAKVTGREYLRLEFDKFICGHQFIEVGPGGVVQPGNSGGPALNPSGRVVGVPARGNAQSTQGWLIPSRIVQLFIEQIRTSKAGDEKIRVPQLGLSLTQNFPGTAVWTDANEEMVVFELGVVISDVIEGSLADKFTLKPNDIIAGFSNKRLNISCALDFKGYCVTTGMMKHWPPGETKPDGTLNSPAPARLHLKEMIMLSEPGDDLILWRLRQGKSMERIKAKMEYLPALKLPHLGTFEKPDFELWGDFVAQDFNDYNVSLFEVPAKEVLRGGALVTFVEPNSLASLRGMSVNSRSLFGFSFLFGEEDDTKWAIIDLVNNKPVKNLAQLRKALRTAEAALEAKRKEPGHDPSKEAFLKEHYVQISFRTNTPRGRILHLTPGFPIDESQKSRAVLKIFNK